MNQKQSIQVGWDWESLSDKATQKWLIPEGRILALIPELKLEKSMTIYDLGCGLGRHSIFFASQGFKVAGSDISTAAVQATQENLKKLKLTAQIDQGKMTEITQPDASFDLVIAFKVIFHGLKPDIVKTLAEIYRILKPGGFFFGNFRGFDSEYEDLPIIIDDHTRIDDTPPEKGIPHYFCNKEDVIGFLKPFLIKSLEYIVNYIPTSQNASVSQNSADSPRLKIERTNQTSKFEKFKAHFQFIVQKPN
jgi:ubiquinone/menaquinone biosynthesis C-methylase UbiE